MSRAADRKRKRARNAILSGQAMPAAITDVVVATRPVDSTRPTPERRAQGKWVKPQGAGKHMQPMVDLASDMIGRLYEEGKLNAAQEQAARTFQELWHAYRGEIGASEFRSCLAGGVGAHDEGDGNPAIYVAWYGLCNRIGRVSVAAIKMNVERQAGEAPLNLPALQAALNRVAGG